MLAILCACGGASAGQEWGGTADTLATGTIVMNNPATGLWRPTENWRIEEVLRVGRLEGEGADVFGNVRALEVTPGGEILVFDGLARELRAFSNEGGHLWTKGRAGAGPNEFQGVIGMSLGPTGELWIVDGENVRYTIVQPNGQLRSHRRSTTVYRFPWIGGFDTSGAFHDHIAERVDRRYTDVFLRIDGNGTAVERFPLPNVELPTPRFGAIELTLPYSPKQLRAWDPRGSVWHAVSSGYRIARVGLRGDTSLVVARAVAASPLGQTERDSIESYVRTLESQFGIAVPDDAKPQRVPLLRWFVIDDENRLWVCATGLQPCNVVDVFDTSGRFLGAVTLPVVVLDNPRPIIRRGMVYAAVEGPTAEPQVFVGRIRQ